jgi:hypothetical protein
MRKNISYLIVLTLIVTLLISVPVIFAGTKNANGENGDQGTNKDSNELPSQSRVPYPAWDVLEDDGDAHYGDYVEGCRAEGGDVTVFVPNFGVIDGGPCCKGPEISEGLYAPNQCCIPPDFIGEPAFPGNHCLCFLMRWDGPLP